MIEAWLDVHYELICLLLPSSFKVKSDGGRAKNTSLDRLHIYSRPVTDEDHGVPNLRGAPGGRNRDSLSLSVYPTQYIKWQSKESEYKTQHCK